MATLFSGAKPTADAAHKPAIQVNQNDKAVMELALNNAQNIIDFHQSHGETALVYALAQLQGRLVVGSKPLRVLRRAIRQVPGTVSAVCWSTHCSASRSWPARPSTSHTCWPP